MTRQARKQLRMIPARVATANLATVKPLIRPERSECYPKSSAARGYGYRWQQARKRFLLQHPLCVHCKAQGLLTEATQVDHIVPHRGDQALFWDETNWQPLCQPCHSRKTQAEGRGEWVGPRT